jgi:hypothetical protein
MISPAEAGARSPPRKVKSAPPRTHYPRSSRTKFRGGVSRPFLTVQANPQLVRTLLAAIGWMNLFLRPRRALRMGRLPGRRTRTRHTLRTRFALGVGHARWMRSTRRARRRLRARRTLRTRTTRTRHIVRTRRALLTVHIRFSRLRCTLRTRGTRRARRRFGTGPALRTRATRTRHIVRPRRTLLTVHIRFSRLRCTRRASHAGTRGLSAARRCLWVSNLVFRTISWP